MGVPQRKVDLDVIRAFIEDGGTKRINFAYTQPTALKRTEGQNCIGWFNLPFEDTIESILRSDLSLSRVLFTLPKTPDNRVYRRIDTEEELHQYDINDTSKAYELAQALLKDPYQRLFNHLTQSNE